MSRTPPDPESDIEIASHMAEVHMNVGEAALIVGQRSGTSSYAISMADVCIALTLGSMLQEKLAGNAHDEDRQDLAPIYDLMANLKASMALDMPLDDDLLTKIMITLAASEGRRVEAARAQAKTLFQFDRLIASIGSIMPVAIDLERKPSRDTARAVIHFLTKLIEEARNED